MQVGQLDSLNFNLAPNPLMDFPSRSINSLEQGMKNIKKIEKKTMLNEIGPTVAVTLSRKGIPLEIRSKIMSQIEDPWSSTDRSKRQTKLLVKYLGQSNFSNLLKILAMYPVVKDIMQAFVNLLLKDSVTHFQVQAILAVHIPHNTFLQQPVSSPLVPISLSYMATLVDDAVKELQGRTPIPAINAVNDKIKEFYEFSYRALYEYFKNYLRINNIEPASPFVDLAFIEFVSQPIILIFKLFMFPILNKLCELNQYEETHEDVKDIDFMDLLTKREPTPSEYEDMKKFFFVPAKTLADQRRRFAKAVFVEQTKGQDQDQDDNYNYGGRRSYQKKNRTNKRLKKNARIKNKKKGSSSRKIHKKCIN